MQTSSDLELCVVNFLLLAYLCFCRLQTSHSVLQILDSFRVEHIQTRVALALGDVAIARLGNLHLFGSLAAVGDDISFQNGSSKPGIRELCCLEIAEFVQD